MKVSSPIWVLLRKPSSCRAVRPKKSIPSVKVKYGIVIDPGNYRDIFDLLIFLDPPFKTPPTVLIRM